MEGTSSSPFFWCSATTLCNSSISAETDVIAKKMACVKRSAMGGRGPTRRTARRGATSAPRARAPPRETRLAVALRTSIVCCRIAAANQCLYIYSCCLCTVMYQNAALERMYRTRNPSLSLSRSCNIERGASSLSASEGSIALTSSRAHSIVCGTQARRI